MNTLNTSPVTADSPKGQRATETFRAQYNKARLDHESAQRLNEHSGFAAYLLAGIKRFSTKAPDYDLARIILGKDFISPEDIQKYRMGVVYTDEQFAQFRETVPSQEVLEWCRDNDYMLMAGPNRPMSLGEIHTLRKDFFYSWTSGRYVEKVFTHSDKVETRWIMFRKKPVPHSTAKILQEQEDLLSDDEVIPNVAEVAWCVTTFKAVRKTYLFPNVHVRTSSFYSDGVRVNIGNFSAAGGLYIYGIWEGDWKNDLGMSAARRQ